MNDLPLVFKWRPNAVDKRLVLAGTILLRRVDPPLDWSIDYRLSPQPGDLCSPGRLRRTREAFLDYHYYLICDLYGAHLPIRYVRTGNYK